MKTVLTFVMLMWCHGAMASALNVTDAQLFYMDDPNDDMVLEIIAAGFDDMMLGFYDADNPERAHGNRRDVGQPFAFNIWSPPDSVGFYLDWDDNRIYSQDALNEDGWQFLAATFASDPDSAYFTWILDGELAAIARCDNCRIAAIPNPGGAWLMGSALLGLVAVRRRRAH